MTMYRPMGIVDPDAITLKYPQDWEEIKRCRAEFIPTALEFDCFADFLMYCEDVKESNCGC